MNDKYIQLICNVCQARMKYKGHRLQLNCKKCNAILPVQRSDTAPSVVDQIRDHIPSKEATSPLTVSASSSEKQPIAESFEVTGTSQLADVMLGILLSVVLFLLVSYFKEDVSKQGLILLLCGTVVVLIAQYYLNQGLKTASRTIRQRVLGLPLFLFLLGTGFLTGLELFLPNKEGICRRMFDGPPPPSLEELRLSRELENSRLLSKKKEDEQLSIVLQERAMAEKRAQWDQADCLLINPGHRVVGLRIKNARNNPEIRVVAKADDSATGPYSAKEILKEFWQTRIPILAHNAELARRVHSDVQENNVIGDEQYDQLRRTWMPICYIPETKPVVYMESKGDRRRFGYRFDPQDKGFLFCDLVPRRKYNLYQSPGNEVLPYQGFAIDSIETDKHIKPGSTVQELLDHELRREADLLDYCVMDMLRKLQGHQNQATSLYDMRAPSIYVDDISLDTSYADRTLEGLRETAKGLGDDFKSDVQNAIKQYETTGDAPKALLATLMKLVNDNKTDDTRKGIDKGIRNRRETDLQTLREQISKLQNLVELQKGLSSEIRTRLVRTQITLVERSPRFTYLASVEAIKRQRNNSTQMVGISFQDAMDAGMLDASHVLMTAVRAPKANGHYELSMRLVDTRTGIILWEEQGDRIVPGVAEHSLSTNSKLSLPKDLTGQWRDPVYNNRFELKDDGENLTVKLFQSNTINEFELRGHYTNDAIKVDSCFITFKIGSGKRHTINASFKRITDTKCEISHETINVNSYGAVYRGSRETVIIERE